MIDLLARWIGGWLDSRLRLGKFARRALNHIFPDHWSFMLGEVALYSFVLLVITGIFLGLFFNASAGEVTYHGNYLPFQGLKMSAAYESVLHLSFDVRAGLLIRQMHHWAADIFIAAIVAHLMRLFFTAAYRRPRELNWMIGVTLLLLALSNGYFGYSLPGDLLSGAGLRIGYAILLSVPVIGPWLAFLFFGGTVPAGATITHFYILHVFVIPVLLLVLIGCHLAIIWRQMHTNYPGPRRTDATIVGSRLWPSYTAKSIGLCFLVFGVVAMLGGLVQIDPIWTYGPYSPPVGIIPGAQPDWYLGWVEGAMRLFPPVNLHIGRWLVPNVFFPALLLPTIVFAALYLYPFFDKINSVDHENHNVLRLPYEQPFNTAFGCMAFMFLLILLFAGGDDVIAVATGTSVGTIRSILQLLAITVPEIIFAVVYILCRGAKRRHSTRPIEIPQALITDEALTRQNSA